MPIRITLLMLFVPLLLAWLPTTRQIITAQPLRESRLAQSLVREVRNVSGSVLGDELEKLLAVGNLQEIIWRLQEGGAVDRAAALQALLEQRLAHGAVHHVQAIVAGRTGGRLIELDDGLRAVFKTANTDADAFSREVLLYNFDNLIGTHVFPLTTTRTIAGEEGSLQLFVENSLSAEDIWRAKRVQLGLDDSLHRIIMPVVGQDITPPASPAVLTLRLLSLENDNINNPGNYLLSRRGRQVAIDGGRAFSAEVQRVEENILHLRENPQAYHLDDRLVANLEAHAATIEAMFPDGDLQQRMHETFASYKEAVANKTSVPDARKASLIEALATQNYDAADKLLELEGDYINLYAEYDELLRVVRKQRDWQLLDWLRGHTDSIDSELIKDAAWESDYEFVARLYASGMRLRSKHSRAFRDNMFDADLLLAISISGHASDWNNIAWDEIDWEKAGNYFVNSFFRRPDAWAVDWVLERALIDALRVGNFELADIRLHEYAIAAYEEERFPVLLNLLTNEFFRTEPQKAEWLITHDVLQKLTISGIGWKQYGDFFLALRNCIRDYVVIPKHNDHEMEASEKILAFLTREFTGVGYAYWSYTGDLAEFFDNNLLASNVFFLGIARFAEKQQVVDRLQRVLDILQEQGWEERSIDSLRRKLPRQ